MYSSDAPGLDTLFFSYCEITEERQQSQRTPNAKMDVRPWKLHAKEALRARMERVNTTRRRSLRSAWSSEIKKATLSWKLTMQSVEKY